MSIGRTNSGSGGGGGGISTRDALIHVTAVIGATITFEKGGVVVKTLDGTKGIPNVAVDVFADYYLSVSSNNYGAWTITATLGDKTLSKTVTVEANEQYDVGLGWVYIYDSGVMPYTMNTTNKRLNSSSASAGWPSVTYNEDSVRISVNKCSGTWQTQDVVPIPLYYFSKLSVTTTSSTNGGSIGVYDNPTYWQDSANTGVSTSGGTATLDLSNQYSKRRVFFGASNGGGSTYATITKIWLEQ